MNTRTVRALGFAIAALIAKPSLAAPPPAADSAAAERYVLVRQNARLFTAPRADAPYIRIHDFSPEELPARLDWVMPMRLLADEQDGFVTVETPGALPEGVHCYFGLDELEPFHLRFFVRPTDLAPVTPAPTRLTARDFPDDAPEWRRMVRLPRGAAVTLHPGTALFDDGKGRLLAASGDFALAADPRPGTAGQAYVPAPWPKHRDQDLRVKLGLGADDMPIRLTGRRVAAKGGKVRVEIGDRCVLAELDVPRREVSSETPKDAQLFGVIGVLNDHAAGTDDLPGGWKIRAGTPAFWPSGESAGTLARDVRLNMPAGQQKGRRCFRIAARNGWPIDALPRDEYFFKLCFDGRAVSAPAAITLPKRPAELGGIAPLGGLEQVTVEDLLVGSGAEASTGSELQVMYTGWLTDGRMFDSSKERGSFKVVVGEHRVIPGWEQGLVGMRAGGYRKLTIPASLGYGQRGAGDLIPPGATLVFQIHLLSVK